MTAAESEEVVRLAEVLREAGVTCLLQFTEVPNLYAVVIGHVGAASFRPADLVLHGEVYLADSVRVADVTILDALRRALHIWKAR